jgi:ATP-dependent DNA helicase RecG
MDHPETEKLEDPGEETIHLNRIVPVYPLTEGLSQRWLRSLVWRALHQAKDSIVGPALSSSAESWSRAEAVQRLHFPESIEEVERARRRLALDELIDFQVAIRERRRRLEEKATARRCAGDNRLIRPLLRSLGFQLTRAQTRTLREIRTDLAAGKPMRRLLQGDVGSGKTVVAACAALMTIESGHDVAFMAPTEILAEQHYGRLCGWCSRLDLQIDLRTANRRAQNRVRSGSGPILTVGTHALLQEAYEPPRLGLVIIDEQHRFGVHQRDTLVRKGSYPHVLVMTATPIPRTLGLTLYGDLEISVIDERPAGRGRIRTHVREEASLPAVWSFVKSQLNAGRQAYVIYPRIDESNDSALKAVRNEFTRLSELFNPYPTGLLHGRLAAAERETVLQHFFSGRVAVLVSTSIVEVGIDVPNASVMVIEGADSFGLAQLHQLRGRIGRGPHTSHCILVAHSRTEPARERLRILESTEDGFRIAEEDLRLRGPGEFLGTQQAGAPEFRFVDLQQDLALVQQARDIAASSKLPLGAGPPPSTVGT